MYMDRTFITRECPEDFTDSTNKNVHLGNPPYITIYSSIMKKTSATSKAKGKKLGSTHAACLVCCQRNDAVLFRLSCSIHQYTDTGCDTSS